MSEISEDRMSIISEADSYNKFLSTLKDTIMDASDYQVNYDKKDPDKVVSQFMKKSGYYKLKKAFGIKISLVEKEFVFNEKGKLKTAIFHVQGELDGEIIDAFGSADSTERGKKGSNDVIGTAHTRAIIRAISQLVDFGSVGAEEIASFIVNEVKGAKV